MFSLTSRYYGLETAEFVTAAGQTVKYVRRRLLPAAERFALLQEHVVTQGDRLDNITAQYLGDPEQFWRICDANNVIDPDELTRVIGARIRLTLPEGVPGVPMLKGLQLSLMIGPVVPIPVARDVIEALQSVQVTTSAGQRSGFQLTFTVGKQSSIERTLLPAGLFDPLMRVIVVVTINGAPQVLMDGLITRQQMTPSNAPGQSTLTVTGEDVSLAMSLIDFSGFPFPAMPAEGRVALMVAKYAMFGIVPLVIPSVLIDIPNPLERIPIQKGNDLDYIHQLADEVGYVFYIDSGPLPGMNTAYWGPEIKIGPPQPALNVNMDAHTNVDSLNFTYDGLSKTLYYLFIQNLLTKAPIPIPIPDVTPLNPPLGAKPPIPLHFKPITSEDDAKGTSKFSPLQAAAIGLAKAAKSSDVISGSGSLDVLRYGRILKARQLVGVRGAGLAYDGLYYVKSVTHNIKHGEYKQSFTLSRNALISTLQKVPA